MLDTSKSDSLFHEHHNDYGCKAWSLTLREERRLRVFENRILRRVFGPRTDENGECRGSTMYRSPNIVR